MARRRRLADKGCIVPGVVVALVSLLSLLALPSASVPAQTVGTSSSTSVPADESPGPVPDSARLDASDAASGASIRIVLDAVPDSHQDFQFSGCEIGTGCSTFSLDDDADPTLGRMLEATGLRSGTYTITQAAVLGWSLTELSCDTGETVDLAARQVTIALSDGEATTCTFTNRSTSITIVQETQPDAAHDFAYRGCRVGASCADFSLDDDADPTLPSSASWGVQPGTYTVSQILDALTVWVLGVECNIPVTYENPYRVRMTVAAGQQVTCTFYNRLVNDDFEHAMVLSGRTGGQFEASNEGATTQPGEVTVRNGVDEGGASVWFRLDLPIEDPFKTYYLHLTVCGDAPFAGTARVSGEQWLPALSAGSRVSNCVSSGGIRLNYPGGGYGVTQMMVAVRSLDGAAGDFELSWHMTEAGGI